MKIKYKDVKNIFLDAKEQANGFLFPHAWKYLLPFTVALVSMMTETITGAIVSILSLVVAVWMLLKYEEK